MIRIVVDSASDYKLEEVQGRNMHLVSITVNIEGNSYLDGVTLDRNDFYEMLIRSEEFPKTSQPSPQAFLDVFEEAKEAGDDVICILLSSALSGTLQSATLAKSMVDYDRIHIVDSLSAAYLIHIMAEHAAFLRDLGLSAEEIVAAIEKLKSRVKVVAALDTLEYLYKGGRLSKTAATIGELANLKPVITLTPEGTIGVIGKCIGKNKAINNLLKQLENVKIDTSFPLYTLYTYGTENCSQLEAKLIAAGNQPTERVQIGPSIGAHVGPEVFGVIYVVEEV